MEIWERLDHKILSFKRIAVIINIPIALRIITVCLIVLLFPIKTR